MTTSKDWSWKQNRRTS